MRRSQRALGRRIEALEARCLLSAGDLDPGFNGNGMLSVDVQGNISADVAGGVAVQTIAGVSKTLVVGSTRVNGVDQPFILRLTPSGALDPTFAGGGKAVVNIARSSAHFHQLAVLPNGSFVAVGDSLVKSTITTYDTQVILAKFTPNGTLDTTFGSKGVVATNLNPASDSANAIVAQPDGKLVVVGLSAQSPDGFGRRNDNGFIARYNAGGSLDATFGSGGVAYVSCDTATTATSDLLNNVTVQADSTGAVTSYTVLGGVDTGNGNHAVVTRLTPTGARMAGWGAGNGRVDLLALGSAPLGSPPGLAIDRNGRVIVAGNSSGGTFAGTVGALTPAGVLDTTFTGGDPAVPLGYTQVPYPTSAGFNAVAVDAANRIVVVGLQQIYDTSAGGDVDDNIQAFRFLPTGARDTTFGAAHGGFGLADATPTPAANSNEHAFAMAIGPDGSIVAVGTTTPYPQPSTRYQDIFLARFQGDPPATTTAATTTAVMPTRSTAATTAPTSDAIRPMVAPSLPTPSGPLLSRRARRFAPPSAGRAPLIGAVLGLSGSARVADW